VVVFNGEEKMPVTDELVGEINTAINTYIEGKESEKKPQEESIPFTEEKQVAEVKEEAPVVDTEVKSEEKTEIKSEEKPEVKTEVKPKLSNEALTRAIRAGLTFEDAKSFANDEALNRVSASIENAHKPVEEENEESDEDDLFAQIPNLDPEEYEEGVVNTFEALKKVIQKQQEELKSMKEYQARIADAGRQNYAKETEKWFDSQISGLGEDLSEILGNGEYSKLDRSSSQFATRDQIANQTAILIAGYQASGIQIDRDKAFQQAVKLVLGDEMAKASDKKLNADLDKRSKQHIQRANTKQAKHKGDTVAEVAAMLDEKFFSGKA
jgi:hypothetical protein